MALIICPECGGKVSDTCNACPHCGFVLKKTKGKAIFKCSDPQFGSVIRWTCTIKDVDTGKVLSKFPQGDSFVMEVAHRMRVQVSIWGFFDKPVVQLEPGETKEIIISARWSHTQVQEIVY